MLPERRRNCRQRRRKEGRSRARRATEREARGSTFSSRAMRSRRGAAVRAEGSRALGGDASRGIREPGPRPRTHPPPRTRSPWRWGCARGHLSRRARLILATAPLTSVDRTKSAKARAASSSRARVGRARRAGDVMKTQLVGGVIRGSESTVHHFIVTVCSCSFPKIARRRDLYAPATIALLVPPGRHRRRSSRLAPPDTERRRARPVRALELRAHLASIHHPRRLVASSGPVLRAVVARVVVEEERRGKGTSRWRISRPRRRRSTR